MIPRDLIPFAIVAFLIFWWSSGTVAISKRMDEFTGSPLVSTLVSMAASFLGFLISLGLQL